MAYTPAYVEKKIGKEKVGFYFGMGTFYLFSKTRGCDFKDMQDEFKKDELGAMADMLYAAAQFNNLEKGLNLDINRYTAFVWMDQMTEEELNDIMDTMAEVQLLGQKLSTDEEGNDPSPKVKKAGVKR